MDNNLTAVVDHVADRLGMAVDELIPIAHTLVRETAIYQWSLAAGGLLLVLALLYAARLTRSYRSGLVAGWDKDPPSGWSDKDDAQIVATLLAGLYGLCVLVAGIIFLTVVIKCVASALTPTRTLLEGIL